MVFSELIAVYLFCGGAAAGSFAVFSAIDLAAALARAAGRAGWRGLPACAPEPRPGHGPRSATWRRIATTVHGAALLLIVAGMLCLLADLGRPEAFYLLFLHPTASLVSVGAFALAILTACLVVALAGSALALGRAARIVVTCAKAAGLVVSIVVMVYTGLLLEAVIAVDLWRSAWLPVLFLLSALSCGCAVVLLAVGVCEDYAGVRAWSRALSMADAAIIVLELVATVACAITVAAASGAASLDALLVGDQAGAFWLGFVGCGMLAPLAIEARAIVSRRPHAMGGMVAAAVLILAGGLCLRLALVGAGVHPGL